jgi:hypothetical protein
MELSAFCKKSFTRASSARIFSIEGEALGIRIKQRRFRQVGSK